MTDQEAKAEAEKIKEEFKAHTKMDRWGDTDRHTTKCAIIHVKRTIDVLCSVGADARNKFKDYRYILAELEKDRMNQAGINAAKAGEAIRNVLLRLEKK